MSENILLLKKAKDGDKSAEDELIEKNMGLVITVAKKFTGRGIDFEDLTQVGAIGLIKAVKRFNDTFGVQFSTYAVPMIMGEIRRFLRDDGIIKISRTVKENAIKGYRAEEMLRKTLKRDPTIKEISAECGILVEDLVEAFDATTIPQSIYYENEDSNFSEKLKSPDCETQIINKVLVSGLLDKLQTREKQIIVLRYFKEKTQAQVAKIIGVSQVQISRIEKKALEKLKKMAT